MGPCVASTSSASHEPGSPGCRCIFPTGYAEASPRPNSAQNERQICPPLRICSCLKPPSRSRRSSSLSRCRSSCPCSFCMFACVLRSSAAKRAERARSSCKGASGQMLLRLRGAAAAWSSARRQRTSASMSRRPQVEPLEPPGHGHRLRDHLPSSWALLAGKPPLSVRATVSKWLAAPRLHQLPSKPTALSRSAKPRDPLANVRGEELELEVSGERSGRGRASTSLVRLSDSGREVPKDQDSSVLEIRRRSSSSRKLTGSPAFSNSSPTSDSTIQQFAAGSNLGPLRIPPISGRQHAPSLRCRGTLLLQGHGDAELHAQGYMHILFF